MRLPVDLPCQVHDPDLWFADAPADLEFAKSLCAGCPVRLACLTGALERRETTGVWGGEIFDHGQVVTYKRARGRPRKNSTPPRRYPAPPAQPAPPQPTPVRVDEQVDQIAIEPAGSGRHRVPRHDLTPPNRTRPFTDTPNPARPAAASPSITRPPNASSPTTQRRESGAAASPTEAPSNRPADPT